MKKLLLSLLAVMISFTALAQTKGDKLTINLKNGKTEAWDLTADGKAPVSKITHSADGKVGFVMTGMEDFGAFNGIYGEYFTEKPARSCVAAKQLPKDVLVEVEVIAEL